jgi:hypothetical protein
MSNALVYHSSPTWIASDYIEPRPSRVLDGEHAVFAAPHEFVSLVFAATWSDDDFEFGFHGDNWYLKEQYPNAFTNIFAGRAGYVYTLRADGFETDSRLGLSHNELINRNPVQIISRRLVVDIGREILRSSIRIIWFGEEKILSDD